MKNKIEMDLLYELASINIVEAEILKLKRMREKELLRQAPKPVGSVDYEMEKVQGGIIESEEQQILNIQCLTAEIMQQEQLLNIYQDTLTQKKEQINSVLTERQQYIFEETFIKGRSCESVADELGFEISTIFRERKVIIEKINKIKSSIANIKSEIFNENAR